MQTVRETLYDSLFIKVPPFMGELLREKEAEIFPGTLEFQEFLRETDSQKRVERAKAIVLRLSFESGILLPTELTTGILRAEESAGPAIATGAYVPQDHYVHLVYLYLLGIYIFFYHKKFHRSLTRFFENLRHSSPLSLRMLSDESALLDFLFCWRAFVLIHDVGYVWELSNGTTNSKTLSEARSMWNVIPDLMTHQLTNHFLSRMSAWRNADSDNIAIPLRGPVDIKADAKRGSGTSDTEFSFIKEIQASELELPQHYLRTPVIHGTRFLSVITSLVPSSELVAQLVHSRLGERRCEILPRKVGGHKVIYRDQKVKEAYLEEALVEMAFKEGRTPHTGQDYHYEWHLFCPNYGNLPMQFNDALSALTSGEITSDSIVAVCDGFLAETPLRNLTITSERDYKDSEFGVYSIIASWSKDQYAPGREENRSRMSLVNSLALKQEKQIAHELAQELESLIEAHLDKKRREQKQSLALNQGIDYLIEEILKPLANTADLKGKLERRFGEEMQKRTNVEFYRIRVFKALNRLSEKCLASSKALHEIQEDKAISSDCLVGLEAQKERVNKILADAAAPNVDQLLDSYRPSFLQNALGDHGLASAVCAMRISASLEGIIETSTAPKVSTEGKTPEVLQKYVRFSLSMGETIRSDEVLYQAQSLMAHVTATIALHNIFPQHLDKVDRTNFRVHFKRSPFTYFAMLCDALQSWDRDRRMNQSVATLPYKVSGEAMNIVVDGDTIRVTEMDHGLNLKERTEKLSEGLEGYLHGVRSLLKIELGEWRHA